MEIKSYNQNAKIHTAAQVYKIALSLKNFGWRQPIVVDKDGVIIVGHARFEAYNKYKDEMNLAELRYEVAEDLTEEQVKAYRLADNLTASTEYDMDIVLEESSQLSISFQDLLRFDVQAKKNEEVKEEEFINDEGYLAYLNNSIRQIVLHYELKDYNELMLKVESLLKYHNLETTSDLFLKLIEKNHEEIDSN